MLFAKEFKKKNSDWVELWFHVEAMGYFLVSGYDQFVSKYFDHPPVAISDLSNPCSER